MEINRGDYTARDAASLRTAVKAELVRLFPSLTFDLEEGSSSVENIMMTPSFYIGDGNHLYIDAMYSEAFLDTLVQLRGAQSKAKLEGYPLSRRTAALASLDYTYTKTDPGAANTITIARGTLLPTEGTTKWTVVSPQVVVLAGGTFAAYQGYFVTDVFTASTGVPDQYFNLSRQNVAGNVSFKITVASVEWNEVERISRAGMTNSYQVEFFGKYVRVRFGDGANGNIPSGSISIEYFITQGTDGTAAVGEVAGTHSQEDVDVDFTNPAVAAGSDGDSVSDLKRNIPGYGRAQDRLVAPDDYIQFLESQPGIMYAAIDYSDGLQKKIFYLMATGYAEPSQVLLDEITENMRKKNQEFSKHEFRAVTEVGAVVSMLVGLYSSVGRAGMASKRQEIINEVNEFFYPTTRTTVYNNAVGKNIRLSDIIRVVERIQGVDYVELRAFTRQPVLQSDYWDDGTNDIKLVDWKVTAAQFGTSVEQMSSFSGLDVRNRKVTTPGYVFEIKLSPARRSWDSWPSTGSLALTVERAFKRNRRSTAHFEVVNRLYDGSVSPSTISSYLGKETIAGFGFFTFELDATKSACSILIPAPAYVDGYPVFKASSDKLVVGSVNVTVTDSSGNNVVVSDDSNGALVGVSGEILGYVDYDSGRFLFLDTGSSSLSGNAQKYGFANEISQEAEIVVSMPVGNIIVRPKEFCGIDSLNVEVTI